MSSSRPELKAPPEIVGYMNSWLDSGVFGYSDISLQYYDDTVAQKYTSKSVLPRPFVENTVLIT